MDKFKQNMENALFSNKTIFIKNKRQPGYANNINGSNSNSNFRANTNSKSLSTL